MEDLIFSNLITALCSGSISWLATVKWQRKEAEATATAHVQSIYQEMIADLNNDRKNLAEDRKALAGEIAELRRGYSALSSQLEEMQMKLDSTERLVRLLRSNSCKLALTCDKFILNDTQP